MNYANHDKIDWEHFMSSISFFITFFTYIKMSKDSSAKFYQINKERLQKKLARNIGVFLKKKKKKVTVWL